MIPVRFVLAALLAAVLGAPLARADAPPEKAALCAACHGEKGVPIDKSIPVIWGQNEGYIYIQLRDFSRGARQNEQMAAIVGQLSRDEMKALAAYFSTLPWPNLLQKSARLKAPMPSRARASRWAPPTPPQPAMATRLPRSAVCSASVSQPTLRSKASA